MDQFITLEEMQAIERLADVLAPEEKSRLLSDAALATVESKSSDGSRIVFAINGYKRPPYRGQHTYGGEGRLRDADGAEVAMLLHADENGRLFELELIRWDDGPLIRPNWETLQVI